MKDNEIIYVECERSRSMADFLTAKNPLSGLFDPAPGSRLDTGMANGGVIIFTKQRMEPGDYDIYTEDFEHATYLGKLHALSEKDPALKEVRISANRILWQA